MSTEPHDDERAWKGERPVTDPYLTDQIERELHGWRIVFFPFVFFAVFVLLTAEWVYVLLYGETGDQ